MSAFQKHGTPPFTLGDGPVPLVQQSAWRDLQTVGIHTVVLEALVIPQQAYNYTDLMWFLTFGTCQNAIPLSFFGGVGVQIIKVFPVYLVQWNIVDKKMGDGEITTFNKINF